MELTKVLYNNACGDWSFDDEFFSDEFLELYKERYGKELEMCNNSYRYDSNVIALYEELGEKRSSYSGARIKVCNFPTKWLHCMEVKVFEGSEHILLSQHKAYKLLLEEIIRSRMVTEDNIKQYEEITQASKYTF